MIQAEPMTEGSEGLLEIVCALFHQDSVSRVVAITIARQISANESD